MGRYGEGNPADGAAAQRGTLGAGTPDVAGQAQQMLGTCRKRERAQSVTSAAATGAG